MSILCRCFLSQRRTAGTFIGMLSHGKSLLSFTLRSLKFTNHSNHTLFVVDSNWITTRTLYSQQELGILGLRERRQHTLQEFTSVDQVQKHKQKILNSFDDLRLHFQRKELINFIYLMDLNPNDVNGLKALMNKYEISFNKEIHQVGDFGFGTEIMRTCHLLDRPDLAVEFFHDQDLGICFQQVETYKVLLDLLLERKRYAEVINCFDAIRTQLAQFGQVPTQPLNCLAFAACYHLKTPTHYQYALDLWKTLDSDKEIKRSLYLLAAMALEQNDIKSAREIIKPLNCKYVTLRYLILALDTKTHQFQYAFNTIKSVLRLDANGTARQKPAIGIGLIDDLETAIRTHGKAGQLEEFKSLRKKLASRDLLVNETLHDHLCVEFPPRLPENVYKKMKYRGKGIRT